MTQSNPVCESFLQGLIVTLNTENERRVGRKEPFLNVAFLVAPVEQSLNLPEFEEFRQFLAEGEYGLNYFRHPRPEWWGEDFVQVVSRAGTPDYYVLTFETDERMWGYCQCEPSQEGYNPKHKCCGNGCDWAAPAFSLERRRNLGQAAFNGLERDYWAYAEVMDAKLAALNADLDRAKKVQQAECLRLQIAQLQERLAEVEV